MIKIIDFKYKTRQLSLQEQQAGENVMRQCLEVKAGEKVLVVTDTLINKNVAPVFFESAKKFTDKVKMIVMKPTMEHGAEPLKEVEKLMCESDAVFIPTFYSLTHTNARSKACKQGVRISSMPGITLDTILRTLSIDYNEVAQLSKKVAAWLTQTNEAFLTSPGGTNIIFSLQGRNGIPDTGLILNNGDYGNLPGGEAFIAPLEGKSHGILVFESCYGDETLNEPFAVAIKNGLMTKVLSTHSTAKKIEANLNKIGPQARNIAELGIGTNKLAKPDKGLLEVEKIYGTCHIALGNNAYFGGEVDVPYHVDGLIIKPTLKLNGKTIIKDGKFVI